MDDVEKKKTFKEKITIVNTKTPHEMCGVSYVINLDIKYQGFLLY